MQTTETIDNLMQEIISQNSVSNYNKISTWYLVLWMACVMSAEI